MNAMHAMRANACAGSTGRLSAPQISCSLSRIFTVDGIGILGNKHEQLDRFAAL